MGGRVVKRFRVNSCNSDITDHVREFMLLIEPLRVF